jgi:hypothetical protein
VAQYSGGLCRTNFAEDFSTHLLTQSTPAGNEVIGVVLRSSVKLTVPSRRKVVEVVVRCDWDMPSETKAQLDTSPNATTVLVDLVRAPNDRRYSIRLRSRCACAGGCGEAKALAAASAPKAKPQSILPPAIHDWAVSTFGGEDSLFGESSAFAKCFGASVAACLEEPGCDYVVSEKVCQPSISTEWIQVTQARDGFFSNCTHVGGNAVDEVSLETCVQKATTAGANVVNYLPWPAKAGRTAAPTTTPAPNAAPTTGCYYKLCAVREMLRGEPSMKRAVMKDEAGFDIYFRNPYYLDDAAARKYDKERSL